MKCYNQTQKSDMKKLFDRTGLEIDYILTNTGCRIFLLVMERFEVMNFLLTAYALNKTIPSYLYITFNYRIVTRKDPNFKFNFNDEVYLKAQSQVVTIAFVRKGVNFHNKSENESKLWKYTEYLFNAVRIWAHATNKTFEENPGDVTGAQISAKLAIVDTKDVDGKTTLVKDGFNGIVSRYEIRIMSYPYEPESLDHMFTIGGYFEWAPNEFDWKPVEQIVQESYFVNYTFPPNSTDHCGYKSEYCPDHTHRGLIAILVAAACLLVLIVVGALAFIKIRYSLLVNSVSDWILDWKKVRYVDERSSGDELARLNTSTNANESETRPSVKRMDVRPRARFANETRLTISPDVHNRRRISFDNGSRVPSLVKKDTVVKTFQQQGRRASIISANAAALIPQSRLRVAEYEEALVVVRKLKCSSLHVGMFRTAVLREVDQMKEINHENILPFIGIFIKPYATLAQCAKRGSLRDICMNKNRRKVFNLQLMSTLLMDVAKGMEYLHASAIGTHGQLRSSKCVIDGRWTCKVSSYGLGSLRKCDREEMGYTEKYYLQMLYMAPELLRLPKSMRPSCGTRHGDVYAYAIIVQEVILMDRPYARDFESGISLKDILMRVRSTERTNPFRPSLGPNCPPQWAAALNECWNENTELRPSFESIVHKLKKYSDERMFSFVELLQQRLENYTLDLKETITKATTDLTLENKRLDALLYSLLPRVVADSLKLGNVVHPESYSSITMLCTDLVGFTKIASRSTPLEIVQLLSGLYSYYDDITGKHSAYKVETIGDAYVVVSGCPIRNKNTHATAISLLALDFFAVVTKYRIPHLPGELLQARGGIHSGPVLAGVVGIKMPRYCLFGETCIITEQMESNSVPNRLHVSHETVKLFKKDDFILEERGSMEIGKKQMVTYFLLDASKSLRKTQDIKNAARKSVKPSIFSKKKPVGFKENDPSDKMNLTAKSNVQNRKSYSDRKSLNRMSNSPNRTSIRSNTDFAERRSVNRRSLFNKNADLDETNVTGRTSLNQRNSMNGKMSFQDKTRFDDGRSSKIHRGSEELRKSSLSLARNKFDDLDNMSAASVELETPRISLRKSEYSKQEDDFEDFAIRDKRAPLANKAATTDKRNSAKKADDSVFVDL